MMDMEGIASLALLPSGSISGHFIHPSTSTCFGIFGTEIECERECSRGEDYRLLKLSILDYATQNETQVVVECRGHDAARFTNATDIHGWEEDVIQSIESNKKRTDATHVTFECHVLKADSDAEKHIKEYLPSLAGRDAIVNIGPMTIRGLSFNQCEDIFPAQFQEDITNVDILHCKREETHDISYMIVSGGDSSASSMQQTCQTSCCLDNKDFSL